MDLMTLAAKIKLDSSGLEKGIKDSEGKMKGFGEKMSAWTIAKGKLLADFAKKAASMVGDFISGSIEEGQEFDSSMSQVAATMGKTVAELEGTTNTVETQFGTFTGNLREYARFMGANTAFSATQAAEALNYMALAGYDVDTSMKMLPNVLNLAAAGGLELADASDMVTDAASALGLSTDETTQLIDKMASASSHTNTSVGQLGEAILSIGGTAKQLKGGTTELTALLGALADNGMKGAEGGTLLRNVLKNLTAPTDQAKKQMKELGLNIFDAKGNIRSMTDIMGDLKKKLAGMSDKRRAEILNTLFDARNLKAVEALMGKTSDDWEELFGYIDGSAGAAERMAETQLDNLAGDTTKFKSALSEVKLMLSDKLNPALRKLTQTGTSVIQSIGEAFKKEGIRGALKAAWEGVQKMFTEIAKLVFGEDENGGVQWPTAGQIWAKVKQGLVDLWDGIKKLAKGILIFIFGEDEKGGINWSTATVIWGKIKEGLGKLWDGIKEKAKDVLKLVFGEDEKGGIAFPSAETVWAKIKEGFGTFWEGLKTKLVEAAKWVLNTPELPTAEGLGQSISDWWNNNVVPTITGIGNFFKDHFFVFPSWAEIKEKFNGAINSVIDGINNAFGTKINHVGDQNAGETMINNIEETAGVAEVYNERLQKMIDMWGEDVVKHQEWFETLGQLKTLIPELTPYIDDHISDINGITQAVKKQIAAWKENAIAQALQTAAEEEQAKVAEKQAEVTRKQLDLYISRKALEQSREALMGKMGGIYGDLFEEGGKLNGLSELGGAQAFKEAFDKGDIDGARQALIELERSTTDVFGSDSDMVKALHGLVNDETFKKYSEAVIDVNARERELTATQTELKQATERYESVSEAIKNRLNELAGAAETARDAVRQLNNEMNGGTGLPYKTNIPRKKAKGDWNVPYDGYLAELHRGEMVLTASQARHYRDGESGGMPNMSGLFSGIVRAVQEGMANAHIDAYMDGKKITRESNRINGNELIAGRFRP